ncbi:MAG: hypothetical protein PHT33_15580 [bacterium]|nr:hypothetical protein [bacterium]
MVTVTLSDADLMRLQMIETDRDTEEALKFIRERILPEVRAQQGKTMISHLDGGKGSML